MKRDIIKINENLCNGCGLCVPNCHEGALQIIDGKARLVSDLMCDGLGACIGHCPLGAISIEKRDAEPYNESLVMEDMVSKGKNTVVAHLKHLRDHEQTEFLQEGIDCLKSLQENLEFSLKDVLEELDQTDARVHQEPVVAVEGETSGATSCGHNGQDHPGITGGCPGSATRSISRETQTVNTEKSTVPLQPALKNWPVQLHLLNPQAPYLKNADLLLAADCVAFSLGDFHNTWLQNKTLAIACPKLDSGMESYIEKLTAMIDQARINTITVMIMEVPCCNGLIQLVLQAIKKAERLVPVKIVQVSVEGKIQKEEWMEVKN